MGDVGTAVGLEVKTDDLDGANLADPLRQEIDLGADEVGDRERGIPGQDVHPNHAVAHELLVDGLRDLADEVAGPGLEAEAHAPARPLRVAAGDRRLAASP